MLEKIFIAVVLTIFLYSTTTIAAENDDSTIFAFDSSRTFGSILCREDSNYRRGAPSGIQLATVEINGMACQGCVQHIQDSIGAMSGIYGIVVSLPAKKGFVKFDTHQWTTESIAKAIESAGEFRAKVVSVKNCDN